MERSDSQVEVMSISSCTQDDDCEDKLFAFTPPLHIQRKRKVLDVIMMYVTSNYPENSDSQSNFKVVDVGCERGAFFQYFQTELIGLRNKFDTTYIGIDISDFTLSSETVGNLNKFCMGNSSDIRNGSISVKLLHENVLYPSFHLDRPDVLVMIEVIEHIKLDDVNQMLPHSIFGEICPKIAIITTPNADFNEIFGLKSRTEFRHWDHKFEWTRNEFKCWCQLVVSLYPAYKYEISDIGVSESFPLHGGGSQMAVFVRTMPQYEFSNNKLVLNSSIVYEKENLFPALFEYDVIKNFLSFKMSCWAIEKLVYIDDCTDAIIENDDDISMPESPDNLGLMEYDDDTGCEIFKISVKVIEEIVRKHFPYADIDFWSLLQDCIENNIYFKLSQDNCFIYYTTESEQDDEDDEEEYLKKYSNLYEKS